MDGEVAQEGAIRVNKLDPNRKAVFSGGQWYEIPNAATQTGAGGQKLTESQAKAGFNAGRMQDSKQTFNDLESQNFDPTLSGAGGTLGMDKSRIYNASKGQWEDAIIRETTGAAATKPEMESADRTYFPQFGDSPAVRAHKAKMRERAEKGAFGMAGPTGTATFQQPEQTHPNGNDGSGVTGATPVQHQTYKQVFKPGAPYGDAANPYIVRNPEEAARVPKGQHFIAPDGRIIERQ